MLSLKLVQGWWPFHDRHTVQRRFSTDNKRLQSVGLNHGREAMGSGVVELFFFCFFFPPFPLTETRMAESLEIYEAVFTDL